MLTQTQTVGESSSKTIVFTLPKGLAPNVIADAPCLTGSGTGCQIGTAVATSPGVPNAALANGIVKLSRLGYRADPLGVIPRAVRPDRQRCR